MNYYDFDDNEGCCLKCTEAHPGCLCFDCKDSENIVVSVFAAVGIFFWLMCYYLGGR